MRDLLTTTEAAAILTARGLTKHNGAPIDADQVRRWCLGGVIAATRSGDIWRGEWRIDPVVLEQFTVPRRGPREPHRGPRGPYKTKKE